MTVRSESQNQPRHTQETVEVCLFYLFWSHEHRLDDFFRYFMFPILTRKIDTITDTHFVSLGAL